MIHTLQIRMKISSYDKNQIDKIVFCLTKTKPHIKSNENIIETTYSNIDEYSPILSIKTFLFKGYCNNYLYITINPAKIIHHDFVNVSDEQTTKLALDKVNQLLEKLGGRCTCDDFELFRIDYSLNYKFNSMLEAERYLKLLKKGNIPKNATQYKKYSETGHRMINPEHSLYLLGEDVTINFYNKYAQILDAQQKGFFIDVDPSEAEGIVRFEIQCHPKKINIMAVKYKLPNKKIYPYIDRSISTDILKEYLYLICGFDDYYNFDIASDKILSSSKYTKTTNKMLDFLTQVNTKKNGVRKTFDKLLDEGHSFSETDAILNQFRDLHINPVTVPEKWSIKTLPNPAQLLFGSEQRSFI